MKAKLIPMIAGLAFAASMPGAAIAGGDYYGGAVSGVAVPAPIPLPVYDPVWYLRLDAGVGFGATPDVTESGAVFGEGGGHYHGTQTFGSSSDWAQSDFDHYSVLGGGIGYRFSDRWRMDITGDYMRGLDASIKGSGYTGLERGPNHLPGSLQAIFADSTKVTTGAFLANAYYEMGHWNGWSPYVGAGLGFAYSSINRKSTAYEVAHERGGGTVTHTELYRDSATVRETDHTLAAMASVGASYKLSDITDLDLSYRYMFIEGSNIELELNGNSTKIEIGDFHDHQLRAGLRFNVN